MDSITTRRPIAAMAKFTAASVVALTVAAAVVTPAPAPSVAVPRIAGPTVALAALPAPLQALWDLATGADPAYPLPTPSNPIAPVAEQFVRNLVSYGGELLAGQGAQIPGQISVRINNVGAVLQTIPEHLANDITAIPGAVAGGAFLGALAGAALLGGAVQVLFTDAEPDSVGAFLTSVAAQIGGISGLVVGAALGLAITPLFWVADALRFRNSLAVALASTVPLPVPGAPSAAVAAVTAIDPEPGDSAVADGTGSSTKRLAVRETPTVTTAAVSTESQSTAVPVEPTPGGIRVAPKLHAWTQPLTTDDSALPAPSPAAVTTVSRLFTKSPERTAAEAGSTTRTKSGLTVPRRSHQKAASKPSN